MNCFSGGYRIGSRFGAHLQIPHRHLQGVREMAHHLRRAELAPLGAAVPGDRADAIAQLLDASRPARSISCRRRLQRTMRLQQVTAPSAFASSLASTRSTRRPSAAMRSAVRGNAPRDDDPIREPQHVGGGRFVRRNLDEREPLERRGIDPRRVHQQPIARRAPSPPTSGAGSRAPPSGRPYSRTARAAGASASAAASLVRVERPTNT